MKTNLFLLPAAATLMTFLSGCEFVGLSDATPNWNETRALAESYTVTNSKAHGSGTIHQISLVFAPVFRWGGSFEAGYQDILENNPGSDDVINVRSNITGLNFLVYQCYFVNIYGATIKYTGHGRGNPDKRPTVSK